MKRVKENCKQCPIKSYFAAQLLTCFIVKKKIVALIDSDECKTWHLIGQEAH